jgi:hypothetical protein
MLETLTILPFSFWAVVFLLLAGAIWAAGQLRTGIGLPMLAVLGTVATWYVGDVLYNNYAGNHAQLFSSTVLGNAWWQVACFLTVFLLLAPMMHGWINSRQGQTNQSQTFRLILNGGLDPEFQLRLNRLFWVLAVVLVILIVIAFIRLGDQIPYYFFPFLGYKADPWARGQIGGGFSALFSMAGSVQMFVAAMLGVVAALSRDGRVRSLALIGCGLTWPGYIFDRTRNSMLMIVLPAILSWVFIRLRMGWLQKLGVLAVFFAIVNIWLSFVIANRSGTSIAAAFRDPDASITESAKEAHHAGLNMYEELCWVNTLINNGVFHVNWGGNYFANLVNPIPRGLWKDKPLIGLDYAVARGQEYTEEGTTATISDGLIGQGVVNFGTFLGPAFAAFLMSLWAVFLAGLDMPSGKVGNWAVFQLGLMETFNLGRDITFIAFYPVIFGLLIVRFMEPRLGGIKSQLRKSKRGT